MGRVYVRQETNKLALDFIYKRVRCREQTALSNTKSNQKKVHELLKRIEAEITLGIFDYASFFPNSPRAKQFSAMKIHGQRLETPL